MTCHSLSLNDIINQFVKMSLSTKYKLSTNPSYCHLQTLAVPLVIISDQVCQCKMCRLGSMIPLYKLFLRTIYRGIKNSTVHIQGNIRFPCICTGELSIPLYNYRGTIPLYVFLLRVVQCRVLAWILETFDHTGLEE